MARQRSVDSCPSRPSLPKASANRRLLAAYIRDLTGESVQDAKAFSGVPAMTQPEEAPLFTPYALGELQLRNRVVMASMTRGRARNAELAPTELPVQYYRQRAAAGLILTEGTWISPRDRIRQRPRSLYGTPSRRLARRDLCSAFRRRCNLRAARPFGGGLASRLFRW